MQRIVPVLVNTNVKTNLPNGFWSQKNNIYEFLSKIKQKYNLNDPEDWNSITQKHIQLNGGGTLLYKYSMYELKCMACPEGNLIFNNPQKPSGYWEDKENISKFLSEIKQKYNLNTPEDWNSITQNEIKSNGGSSLLNNYSMYELKCMACPEGNLKFDNQKKTSRYWENKENIYKFLSELKYKYKLNTPEDWNSIVTNQIISNGGSGLLKKYSMFELKCMACPEGKFIFKDQQKPSGYWDDRDKVAKFLFEVQEKYDLNTPELWNSITHNQIASQGGSNLLKKYSLFELKCMACPEGKSLFSKKNSGYWEIKENVKKFLSEIQQKYNLNSPDDWNSITYKHIYSHGGRRLLNLYSINELKCMGCPDGELLFKNPPKHSSFWEIKDNVLQFLEELKVILNLNTPEDWNSITRKQIQLHGGSSLLSKYSITDLKKMGCPEGISFFDQHKPNPSGYWENENNILDFLSNLQQKYNLNTPDDWNLITRKYIQSNGGASLLHKYSMYELKCMACPEGKLIFKDNIKPSGYWKTKGNISKFLSEIQQKYNLNSPEDWNSITHKQILSHGGASLLHKYTLYELKCMACPEGKSIFENPKLPKPAKYWENKNNIYNFLSKIKQKYNLNTPEDWNTISTKLIQSNGGCTLLGLFSIYELKCLACPEGEAFFYNQYKPTIKREDTENETNRNLFFEKLKHKYNLKTPNDWKRLSKSQIISQGGNWLFNGSKNYFNFSIKFESSNNEVDPVYIPLNELISETLGKRSSQRYLFLQIQKLFPGEEIVEDYFHSEISRDSGFVVQFDIFMIQRKIAIEYHGRHHYEDIPQAFSNLETYKHRDIEKEKLCKKHGIQLIVIPYWWDNNLDSLKETLKLQINM